MKRHPFGAMRRGDWIAALLRGCWREPAPAFEGCGSWDEDAARLRELLVPLIKSGAGALVWKRIKGTPLEQMPEADELRQTHRMQVLYAGVREREIATYTTQLREAGVEAVLLKGRSNGRFYADKGLRPPGDIDLLILPQDKATAERILGVVVDDDTRLWDVDVKSRFSSFYEMTAREILGRSQEMVLDGRAVRVPGTEDHLRLACLHALKHGFIRPLWLCDIAAVLERCPSDFDWRYFKCGSDLCASYIDTALLLAHRLLGADISATPAGNLTPQMQRQALPSWVSRVVLGDWSRPNPSDHLPFGGVGFAESMRDPKQVLPSLRNRWPNPITVLSERRLPLHGTLRLPLQVAGYATLCGAFLLRLPRELRSRPAVQALPIEETAVLENE